MKRRRTVEVVLSQARGILLLILSAHFCQRGDLTMALLTDVAGIASLVLARQDFTKLRWPPSGYTSQLDCPAIGLTMFRSETRGRSL